MLQDHISRGVRPEYAVFLSQLVVSGTTPLCRNKHFCLGREPNGITDSFHTESTRMNYTWETDQHIVAKEVKVSINIGITSLVGV